jgi:hypothetical protein
MIFTLFGYVIEITKANWVSNLIRRATAAGKEWHYDMKVKPGEISWKINRIKAIRLLSHPFPKSVIGEQFYVNEAEKASLSSAKTFVERYWFE